MKATKFETVWAAVTAKLDNPDSVQNLDETRAVTRAFVNAVEEKCDVEMHFGFSNLLGGAEMHVVQQFSNHRKSHLKAFFKEMFENRLMHNVFIMSAIEAGEHN